VLQHDAVCCRVLQCVAVCCSAHKNVPDTDVWQGRYFALCRSVLQCAAVYCSVLQCIVELYECMHDAGRDRCGRYCVLCFSVLQAETAAAGMLQGSAVRCSVLQIEAAGAVFQHVCSECRPTLPFIWVYIRVPRVD